MENIIRTDINENYAHAGVIVAGDFVFVGYCAGNVGQPIEAQVHGALDNLSRKLESVGLTLASVVKFDALFKDIRDIPSMESVLKERLQGKYPVRKSIQTEFDHDGGLLFQMDAIAYKGN